MRPQEPNASPAASPWTAAAAPQPMLDSAGVGDAETQLFVGCYACGGKLRLKRKHLGISGSCVYCRVPVIAWERFDMSGTPQFYTVAPQIEPAPPHPAPGLHQAPPMMASSQPEAFPVVPPPAVAPSPVPPLQTGCASIAGAAPSQFDNHLPLPPHHPPPSFKVPGPLDPETRAPGWEPQFPVHAVVHPLPQVTMSLAPARETVAPSAPPVVKSGPEYLPASDFPSGRAQPTGRGVTKAVITILVLGALGCLGWLKRDVIYPAVKEWLMPNKISRPAAVVPTSGQAAEGMVVTKPCVLPLSPGMSPEQVLEAAGRKLLEQFYVAGTILDRMSSVIPSPGVETAMKSYYARFPELPVLAHADWVGRMRDPGSGLWFGVFDVRESTSDKDFRWCVVEVIPGTFLLDWHLHHQLADDSLEQFMADNAGAPKDLTLILRRGAELEDIDNPWKPDSAVEVYLSLPLSRDRGLPQRVVLRASEFDRLGFGGKLTGSTTRIARVRLAWIASEADPLIRLPVIEECYSWGAWDAKVGDQIMIQANA